jgi:integrin alpha 7
VVTVKIKWPHQVENFRAQGKWLLYLTEHPYLKNGRGDCTVPAGYPPNPLNLTRKSDQNRIRYARYESSNFDDYPDAYSDISDNTFDLYSDEHIHSSQNLSVSSSSDQLDFNTQAKQRVRRDIEHIVAAQRVWNPSSVTGEDGSEDPGQLVVRLDCDRGTAKCLTITCQVYNLAARDSVTVEIKARLWNSTLVEDYSDVDSVEIYSKSSVIIDSVYTQDPANDHESILTVALPDRQLEPRQPPAWWIYILSAAVGVLLLFIIIMVLSKVGFFQRNRPLEEEGDDSEFMMSAHCEKVKLNGSGIDSF